MTQTAAEILDGCSGLDYPTFSCLDVVKCLVDGLTNTTAPSAADLWPRIHTTTHRSIYHLAILQHGDRGGAWTWGLDQIAGLQRLVGYSPVQAGDVLVVDGTLHLPDHVPATINTRDHAGVALYARTATDLRMLLADGLVQVVGGAYSVVAHYRPTDVEDSTA